MELELEYELELTASGWLTTAVPGARFGSEQRCTCGVELEGQGSGFGVMKTSKHILVRRLRLDVSIDTVW